VRSVSWLGLVTFVLRGGLCRKWSKMATGKTRMKREVRFRHTIDTEPKVRDRFLVINVKIKSMWRITVHK